MKCHFKVSVIILYIISVNAVSRQGNLVSTQHGFSWTNISNINTVQSLWYDLCEITNLIFV